MRYLWELMEGGWGRRAVLLVALFSVVGLCAAVVCAAASARKRKRLERERQAERERQFTLPDRENTFIRDRLNTTLRPSSKPRSAILYFVEKEGVRLEYSRALLTRLKRAKLAVGDRLETEEMSKKLTELMLKDGLTGKELRELNELFSSLLKMSAKYSV